MENEKKEKIFAEGIWFKKPREGSPDFVKGNINIKVPELIIFLQKYQKNSGYVNLDLKKSAKGTLYLELNTWEPKDMAKSNYDALAPVDYPKDDIKPEDIPFS